MVIPHEMKKCINLEQDEILQLYHLLHKLLLNVEEQD